MLICVSISLVQIITVIKVFLTPVSYFWTFENMIQFHFTVAIRLKVKTDFFFLAPQVSLSATLPSGANHNRSLESDT